MKHTVNEPDGRHGNGEEVILGHFNLHQTGRKNEEE